MTECLMFVEMEVTISKKQKKVPAYNSEKAAMEDWIFYFGFDILRNGMKYGQEKQHASHFQEGRNDISLSKI